MNDNYIKFKEKPTIRYFNKLLALPFIVVLFFAGVSASAQCVAPTINSVTTTDPTCTTGGQIVIDATDNNAGAYGDLEYSVDNGSHYQSSNTFTGLAAGDYDVIVRHVDDHSCSTTYASNPVTLNSATGCGSILETSISSCNQGYTKDGEYKITYSISIFNNSYHNTVSTIQLTNDLNAIFNAGSINQIDRNNLSTANEYPLNYPLEYDGSDWDTAEFPDNGSAGDPTPGDDGIFNATSVANDVLYPRQRISISYCIYLDPAIAGGQGVGSGNGVAFDNIINVTSNQNNPSANVNITDFHTTETTVAANLYVPVPAPTVNWDGTYDFTNTVIIKNDGVATANNVQFFLPMNPIVDDAGNPITINTQVVTKVSGPVSIDVNASYDGHNAAQTGITNGGSLAAGEVAIFSITYNVGPTVDNSWSPFNVVNPSMTQGNADGHTEDSNADTYVQWTDNQGAHLDRYYTGSSATDEPSSTDQCQCDALSMYFPYQITLSLDKSIESDVPAASGILGNRDITFRLKAKNNTSSQVRLTNLHLIDDLQSAFGANLVNVSTPNLIHVNAEQDPNLDPAYDGQGNNDIFDGNSGILNPGEEVWVDITVELSRGVNSSNTASFYGNDPNTLTVTQASSAVAVTVANQPPVATDDSVTTPEDTTVSGNVINDNLGNGTDSDPENDPLTVIQFVVNGTTYNIPVNGSATANLPEGDLTINSDGNFTFVPAPNYNGAVPQATYTIDDGNGGTDTATLDINVTPVNDVPVAQDDNTSTNEDTAVSGDVSTNDTPSGDGGNTWSLNTGPTNGSLTFNSDGTYIYTPDPNFNGSDSFTYTITDADGDTSTATVVIVVNPVNDVPVATDDNNSSTNEDTPVSGSVSTNDTPSGDGGNTWSVTGQPAHGTVTMDSNGNYTYTPDPDYNGPDSFTYQVCDVDGDCSPATVNLTVNPVNDPPVAEDDSDETMINTPVTIDVLNNDDDPNDPAGNIDPSTVTVTSGPANGTTTVNPDGSITYTPNPGFSGNDTFEYQVCDDGNPLSAQCTTATVNVFVQNPELTVTKEDAIPANATVGDDVTYTIVVTNTGNVPVTSIDLQDSNAVPATITVGDLAPGEHYIATVTHTITQADMNAGGFDNQATATGKDPNGNPVTAISDDPSDPTDNDSDGDGHPDDVTHTDLTPYQVSTISATLDNNNPSTPTIPIELNVGDAVNYTLDVENTGNMDLPAPTVPAGYTYLSGDDGDGILNPGETWEYTSTYNVTQSDIDAGQISSQFMVTAGVASDITDDPQFSPADDPTVAYLDQSAELTVTKQDAIPAGADVGDDITYTIIVINTGNVTLTGVNVTDANATITSGNPVGTLAPGASANLTATHTITQSDMDNGGFNNVAVATGRDPNGDSVTDTSDDPDTLVENDPTHTDLTSNQNPELTVTKDDGLTGTQSLSVGSLINYNIDVTNTGNVTLSNILVNDDNANISSGSPIASLAPGATATVIATHIVTQADIDAGEVLNSATAIATFNGDIVTDDSDDADGVQPGDDDPTLTTITQTPELTVTKDDMIPANATVGDDVTYTIVVTNTGNVTVSNIEIADSNAVPATITVGTLAPGGTYTATVTHTITQADMNAGGFDNQAVAMGDDPNGNSVSDLSDDADGVQPGTDDPTHTDLMPYQVGEITTTLDDNDISTATNPSTYFAGDNINYNLNVENTGNVSISNVTPPAGYTPVLSGGVNVGDTNGDGILDPGEVWQYTGSHTVTQTEIDSGSYSEQVSVSGDDPNSNTVTDSASDDPQTGGVDNDPTTTYFDLQDEIEVKKQDTMPMFVQVGQDIEYTITVTNHGNTSVLNLVVTDDNSDAAPVYQSGDTDLDGQLDPNETWTYYASHEITQADMDAGEVANVAQATGTNTAGDPVEDMASDDPDTPQPDDPTISDLHPYQNPSITTIKTVDHIDDNGLAGISADDVIVYSITVENTGNVTISHVTVTDDLITNAGGTIGTPVDPNSNGLLDVGETWTYTVSYTITQSDMDSGSVTNTATAHGLDPNNQPVTDVSDVDPLVGTPEDPTVTTLLQDPKVEVTKVDALPANVAVGEVITYTIVVTNTGNVSLNIVHIDDSNAVMNGVGSTPLLEPGDSVTFTAVHTITQDDMNNGSITNVATVHGTDPNGNDITDLSDDTDNPADVDSEGDGEPDDPTVTDLTPYQAVSMEATLDDNLQTDANNPYNFNVGDIITYTAELTNTGNVSINPTTPAGYTPVEQGGVNVGDTNGDGVLDPGETWVYETTHTVTQADIDAGYYDTQVTFDGVGLNGDNVSDVSDDPQDNTTTTDDVTVTYIGQNPELTVVKTGEFVDSHLPLNGLADVGEVINYTIVVTNSGNVTLTDVVVTDPNATNITPATIGTMAPGDVVTVTAQHELTQADIDAAEVSNQATASGQDPMNNPVSDISDDPNTGTPEDPTIVGVPVHAEITVEKTGHFNDEDGDGFANVGETITYTFNVTNAGNQTISDLDVSDPLLGGVTPVLTNGDTNGNHLLDVLEVWTYTADYVLTQADIDEGFIDNQALTTASDPNGAPLTDLSDDPNNSTNDDVENDGEPDDVTHTIVPQNPDLDVLKVGHFNDEDGDGLADIGETITYTFTVTNIGNVTLHDITIDDALVSVNGTLITLAPGDSDSVTFTAEYTITKDDLDAGKVINTATVTGYDPQGDLATDVSDDPNNSANVDPDGDGNPDDPTVVETLGLNINTIFTPNGDGINDTWVINGLQNFPNNNVKVYNRWGNLVYDKDAYMNTWDGFSNGRAKFQGSKLLPVGTYFYVIDLGDGHEPFTGYLYLNR